MESTKFLAVVAVVTVSLFVSSSWAVKCYDCSTDTKNVDNSNSQDSSCGLPFRYNASASGSINIIDCQAPGVCVTQTTYRGATSSISRSCTYAPVTDGCEKEVDASSSQISWTCISTCTGELCNTGSDATSPLPPQLTTLLLLSVVASIFWRGI